MNKERLELVAKLLEELPDDRFDLNQWVGVDWKGAEDLSCGTTACALGWATTIGELREAGLRLVNRVNDYARLSAEVAYIGPDIPERGLSWSSGLAAAECVFDISADEAQFLFISGGAPRLSGDATAKQAAQHIRKFIEQGGIPE